ncbi:MAG TPA: hypothetical protein VD994_21565 [Prosthecobacter sp.]|nr:hypothetical protein [Prosthecobacter sp.]
MTDDLQLLRDADDPRRAEAPSGFDRRAAEARFAKMAEMIVAAFPESTFETGKAVQDAAFHGQVRLVLGRGCQEHALIRASNFGGFVAIHDDAHSLSREQRHWLLTLFPDQGYTFIPEKVLALPYDGGNPDLRALPDWWERYFEWL